MLALKASTVTVAIWPSLTLPISASLRATTSCIELRSLSTAKAELEDPVDPVAALVLAVPAAERPVEAAPLAADALDPEPVAELPELDALVVPLPETTSPTCPDRETIVPLCGA